MKNYSKIINCRLCKSENLQTVFDFGLSPLANSYPSSKNEEENEYPLTVAKCDCCGHVQLRETVSPEVLFSNYSYASSDSPSLLKHFSEYASTVCLKFNLSENTSIFEIGSNDGILLNEFSKLGFISLYGIDPATNISERAKNKGAKIINAFFNHETAKDIKSQFGKMNVICANNVFAHVADIEDLTKGIAEILTDDGIFIFENAYLLDTIKGLYFDQVYHEHLQYYGIKPLVKYLSKFDLEIFDIQKVSTQGGSFRIFAKRVLNKSLKVEESVSKFIEEEEKFGLYKNETYKDFVKKIENLSNKINVLIENAIQNNITICCYGCPAKFTLFSKVFNLNKEKIKYVVEDSPLKQGKYSPGLKIPIVSKSFFQDNPTDLCIISAWNMAESIIKNNQWYKGKFIVPMPEVKIIEQTI